jgi:hypothetical protein
MDRLDQLELVLAYIFKEVDKMNAQVQALVSQVATSVATEAKAITEFGVLSTKLDAVNKELQAAIANDFGADDVAALTKAVSDLSASATALAAATPFQAIPAVVTGS